MPEEKLPPHDNAAEEAVIGSLLLRGSTANRQEIADAMAELAGLKAKDCWREKNRWVFEAILSLHKAGTGIDQITVAYWLRDHDRLEAIGGPAYLLHCIASVATSYHLGYYAQVVRDCARRRELIAQAGKLVTQAYTGDVPPSGGTVKEVPDAPIW